MLNFDYFRTSLIDFTISYFSFSMANTNWEKKLIKIFFSFFLQVKNSNDFAASLGKKIKFFLISQN